MAEEFEQYEQVRKSSAGDHLTVFWTCQKCGNAVVDRDAHNGHHSMIRQAIRELAIRTRGAYDRLGENL